MRIFYAFSKKRENNSAVLTTLPLEDLLSSKEEVLIHNQLMEGVKKRNDYGRLYIKQNLAGVGIKTHVFLQEKIL